MKKIRVVTGFNKENRSRRISDYALIALAVSRSVLYCLFNHEYYTIIEKDYFGERVTFVGAFKDGYGSSGSVVYYGNRGSYRAETKDIVFPAPIKIRYCKPADNK